MRKKSAYTTLELLIVLTIIGFFVAMVGPKLVGMFSDSQEKISRANISDLSRVIGEWQLNHPGLLPNDMTNIVYFRGGNTALLQRYHYPSLAEKFLQEDGAEWLCWDMVNRLKIYRHRLTQEEVDELNSMGLTHVRVLDSADADKRMELADGMGVLMIGARRNNGGTWQSEASADYGADWLNNRVEGSAQDDPAGRSSTADGGIPDDYEAGIAYPELLYRIILAVGPDCQLIKDGTMDAAPHSPDAMSRPDDYRFDQYIVVLPRLQATVDSLNTAGGMPATLTVTRTLKAGTAYATTDQKDVVVCDTIGETVQSPEQFEVLSPEGFGLNDAEEILWTVSGVTNN